MGTCTLRGSVRAILSEISIASASLYRTAVNNTFWELQEYKKKWSKGHAGCWAPGVDGGLRFPGHQDGLENFIASLYRPRSKTARIYFLPGEMQKSKVQRQLTQSHLKKINLLKVSISLKRWREAFFFRKKKKSISSKKCNFCLKNEDFLNLIFPHFIPSKIANVSV